MSIIGCVNKNVATKNIGVIDRTKTWTLPYIASEVKVTRIVENIEKLEPKMQYSEAVALFGEPDTINDLQGNFFGLSPQEDGFLVQYRPFLSYRAIWYLKKNYKMPCLRDKWLIVYLASDEDTVFYILQHNVKDN